VIPEGKDEVAINMRGGGEKEWKPALGPFGRRRFSRLGGTRDGQIPAGKEKQSKDERGFVGGTKSKIEKKEEYRLVERGANIRKKE